MKIAFIGGGNMAAALIGGLLRAGDRPESIWVVEVDAERLARLKEQHGIGGSSRPDAGMRGADATVFAVKPQQMQAACGQCRRWITGGFVLSIAAGIPAASIAAWSGQPDVVRAMPNTPALIGAGIAGVVSSPGLGAAARALAQHILATSGQVVWFEDEAMLDAVTAISGSGPAYVFYFIEALQAAARSMGMSDEQARLFSVSTFLGAARLAAESTEPVEVLRERVTSKGGTTAAALASLQSAQVDRQFVDAAFAALARSRELALAFGVDAKATP